MASGGRHGLAQSVFQVGGNVGSSLGPLLAAFLVLPRGQSSIAWASGVALLAIAVLWKVGGWSSLQNRTPRPKAPDAHTIHHAAHVVVTPARVVELMILNSQMPRSLLASLDGVCENLAMLRTQGSNQCERFAGKLRAELLYSDIRQIFEAGLHAWLTQFLKRVDELGLRVMHTFLMLPIA